MAKLSNSPKQALNFDLERRKSYTFRVRLRHKDASLVDLTGCTLRFVMKQQGAEEDPFDLDNLIVHHEAIIGDPSTGEATFAFQAAELDGDPGEYNYSVVLWTPDNYSTVVCKGVINLIDNSEAHSMHRMYSALRPGSTVDLLIRDDDVVEVTAGETVQLITQIITLPGGGINTEAVQDIVGAMVAGAGGTYDDADGTITLPSGGGGSASELTPVTTNTTTPPGSTVGNLVGYVNTASAPITVNGQPLAAGAWAVFGWSGSAWVQMSTGTLVPAGTPVTATAPTFNDASGTSSDTYTIPTKAGVEYLVGGTVTAAGTYPGAGTVTITAQATSGYTLTGISSWSHTFSTVTNPTSVTPTGPTWTDDAINGGGTWMTPTQTGVTYSPASGTATPGQSVTVTATAQSGYTLTGTTSWNHTFPNAPSAVSVTDSFNRSDNATSLGTTETGGKTWEVAGGTWGITGNKAGMLAGSAIRGHANVDLGATNMAVEARMNVPAGSNSYPSVVGRYVDPANCYMLQNSDSAGVNKTVLVRIGGVNTFMADSLSIPSNGLLGLTLVEEGSGTRVRVYADGVEVWSGLATMAGRPNGTKAGLFAYTADAGARFDDFKAELL